MIEFQLDSDNFGIKLFYLLVSLALSFSLPEYCQEATNL